MTVSKQNTIQYVWYHNLFTKTEKITANITVQEQTAMTEEMDKFQIVHIKS